MTARIHRPSKAFTLIELLVSISVIFILAALLFSTMKTMRDRGKIVKCISNLKVLSAAAIMYANDHDGFLWTSADVGNSKYRMWEDEKSPCQLLSRYAPPEAWICPGAPKTMVVFKNNYTWNVASKLDNVAVATLNAPLTVTFWDAFAYNLPTMKNANEALNADGTGKGPATAKVQTKYHAINTKANYGYLDGHVETR